MSDAFDRFRKSNFFGSPFNAWHDGLDTRVLTVLQGGERAKAEEMLLKALPDNRAIVGLGVIRSQKAVAPLRKLLRDQKVSTEVSVALFLISGDTSGLDSLINTLKNRHLFWSDRMDAAIALRNFRTEKASDALLDALTDPEGLVRHHAAQSLLTMYGHASTAGTLDANSLAVQIMREPTRAAAAETLRQMVRDGKLSSSS